MPEFGGATNLVQSKCIGTVAPPFYTPLPIFCWFHLLLLNVFVCLLFVANTLITAINYAACGVQVRPAKRTSKTGPAAGSGFGLGKKGREQNQYNSPIVGPLFGCNFNPCFGLFVCGF